MTRPDNRPRLAIRALSVPTLALSVVLLAWPCYGQIVNATLSGTVSDPTGASIPEASVTVTNVATGVAAKTTTDSAGNYNFASLPPGNYDILVEKAGFTSKVVRSITLQVDQKAISNIQLEVGNVTQQVEVTAAVPLVSTQTATVGTVVTTQQVVELPLNLREYGSLATLVPGTTTDNGGFASSTFGSPFSQTSYNSNGNRSASNSFLVDGIESRNLTFGGFALQPPPDAVQEFNLETNIYSAAFGLAAGSSINLTTKSGTNQIHGSVYEFLRNDVLDARNFFNLNQTNPATGAQIPGSARPEFRRNQFGFVLGGPIKKDKTFWFVNYEGLRRVQGGSSLNTVPTAQELTGNLSAALTGKTINLCGAGGPSALNFDGGQLFNPGTITSQICPAGSAKAGSTVLVGTPIPGNMITTIDPVAAHTISLNPFPAPNYPGVTNFIQTSPITQTDNSFIVRIDQNFSAKDQLFGRYMFGQSTWNNPYTGYTTLPTFGDSLYFRGQNVALGWTHSISTNILNEARFGFQRDWDNNNCASCPRAPNFMSSFGINGLNGYAADSIGFPIFGFINFATIGDSNYRPVVSPDMLETYADTVHWTKGKHSMVFGADLEFWQVFGEQAAFSPHGELDFKGQYSTLNGELSPAINGVPVTDLADFLLGYPNGANETLRYQDTNQAGGKFWSFFGQDDIKVSPNLTLNLGLRWEYRGFPIDKRNNFVTFWPTGAKFSGPGNGLLVSAQPNAQNDAYCTNPQYSFLISSTGSCLLASATQRAGFGFTGRTQQTLVFPYYGNWNPRFGFAWQPFGTGKVVVRGGFGLFTDLPNFNNQHFVNNNPLTGTSILFSTSAGAPTLVGGVPVTSANVFSAGGTPPLSEQFISLYVSPNYKDPTVEEWSFGIQDQLSQNVALEVNYIGNHAYHLGALHLPGNQPKPTPLNGSLQADRPYPDFGTFLYTSPEAISNYNALQIKLNKRFSNGFSLLGAFTWQNAFDNNEGDEGFGTATSGNFNPQNDNCLSCNYGQSYSNAHKRFVLSGIWQLPVGEGQRFLNRGGVVNVLLGGWQASGIYSLQSGFPFTVISNRDWSNSLSNLPLPDRTCNGNNGPKTVVEWFDTTCFTTTYLQAALNAGTPRYGNEVRNGLIGPTYNNLDFALLKNFSLSERFKLQFRFETFNTFNHANFSTPNSTANTATNGVITSTVGSANGTGVNANRDIQFALKLSF